MSLEAYEERITTITRKDSRYDRYAYAYTIDVVDYVLEKTGKEHKKGDSRHVTIPEFLVGFRRLTRNTFGPMALTAMERWGIKSTRDIGNIVYNLINARLLKKRHTDDKSEFSTSRHCYNFEKAFRNVPISITPNYTTREE